MSPSRAKSIAFVTTIFLLINLAGAFYVVSCISSSMSMPFFLGGIFLAIILEMFTCEVPYYGYISIAFPLYIFSAMIPETGGWAGACIIATIGITARTFGRNSQPGLYKAADFVSSLLNTVFAIYTFSFIIFGVDLVNPSFITNVGPKEPNFMAKLMEYSSNMKQTGIMDIRFALGIVFSAIVYFLMDAVFTTSTACFLPDEHMKAWNVIRKKIRVFYFASFAISLLGYFSLAFSVWGFIWVIILLISFYITISYILEEVSTLDSESIAQELTTVQAERDNFEKINQKLSGDLRKKIDEISVIHEMGKSLESSTTVEGAINTTISMIRKFIKYQTCAVFLLGKDGGLKCYKADSPYKNTLESMQPKEFNSTVVSQALQVKRGIVINEELPEGVTPVVENERSIICIPLIMRDKVIGMLYIGDPRNACYDDSHLGMLETLSLSVSVSIESALLYEQKEESFESKNDLTIELQKSVKQLSDLNELGKFLGSSLKIDDVLNFVCSKINNILEFQTFIIFSIVKTEKANKENGEDEKIVETIRVISPYADYLADLTYKYDDGILGSVIKNMQPVILGDNFKSEYPNLLENEPSSIIIPMVLENEVYGIFYAGSGKSSFYDENNLNLLSTVAYQTAMAIKNCELYEQMVSLAITDGLTGLYTHRYFQERLAEACKEYDRTHKSFSLIMIDADHFKTYNDTLGHPEGDKLLKEIAELLKTYCRDTDIVARYGGDEFAVILKESDKVNAIRVAERIRDAFNRRFATYRVPITASLGIANFPQDASQKDEFIVAADKALYESKKHGRDRVTAAPSMTDAGSLLAGADDRKTSKMSAKNKTKALTPQQLEEMKKSYFSSLNAKSTNLSPLINKENSFRGQRNTDMRFHVPDAPSEMNINRKSIKTQIFNPEASPLTQQNN